MSITTTQTPESSLLHLVLSLKPSSPRRSPGAVVRRPMRKLLRAMAFHCARGAIYHQSRHASRSV